MMRRAGGLGLLLLLAGCSELDESGAPTTTSRSPNLGLTRRLLTFHEHELELAELVSQRAGSDTVRALGRRGRLSHEPQARALRAWLERWSANSTSTDSSARPSGLASSEEMAELANATGAGFDRLFLALMTRHHEQLLGALQSKSEARDASVPGELIDTIRAVAQTELDEMRATLARSPE